MSLMLQNIPQISLEQHVNSCLDLQDRNTSNNVKLPTKHDKEETGDPKVHNTEASSRQKHDVFTSLGLKMDSFDPKNRRQIVKLQIIRRASLHLLAY